ncbi:TraG protein [Gammaproteobacteria bacterium]
MSHAVTELDSLGKSLDSRQNISDSLASREAISTGQSASNMRSTAKNIAERNHLDVDDVFRGLINFSQNASPLSASASFSGKIPLVGLGEGKLGLSGEINVEHTRTSETSTRHGTGRSMDVTAEEAKRFSEDLHKVEEYSKTHHVDQSKSTAASHLSQLSTDLRNTRTASEQYSAHKAESDRLSHAASYIRQNSAQIDGDWNQVVVDKIIEMKGQDKAEELFSGKNMPELISAAKDVISQTGIESNIISAYQQGSSGISPNQKYQTGTLNVHAKSGGIKNTHAGEKQKLAADAKSAGVGVNEEEFKREQDTVKERQKNFGDNLKKMKKSQDEGFNTINTQVTKDIAKGSENAKKSAFSFGEIKPDFANLDKNKKGGA